MIVLNKFFRVSTLQGFEVPALVYFGNIVDGLHNNEIFSRCISNLFLISMEQNVRRFVDETTKIIPILGEFYFSIIFGFFSS
jgi:hypothetical protein